MIKSFIMAAALVLAAATAQAGGNNNQNNSDSSPTNVQNTQGQLQGQAQGQFQGQLLNSNNEAFSASNSKSSSTAVAASKSGAKASADNKNSVSNTIGGDSINFDAATASAAVVLASNCSQGGSAQAKDVGVSFGAPSRVCEHIMLAESYMNAARVLKGDKQAEYVTKAADQLEKAGLYVDRTSPTAMVARITSDVSLPFILFIALKFVGI